MVELTDDQIKAAEGRGQQALASEPRAVTARYDAKAARIVVELANGCAYAFPVDGIQELRGVDASKLAEVKVEGAGFNLSWPNLDVDLYVPALVAGIFGTQAWMASELARIAGRSKSPGKTAASRANGAKGGRPRKTAA